MGRSTYYVTVVVVVVVVEVHVEEETTTSIATERLTNFNKLLLHL